MVVPSPNLANFAGFFHVENVKGWTRSMDLAAATRDIRELFVSCELARARTARAWGRSPVELSALIHIRLTEGVTPHAIASRLSLTTGSVTALLDRLQSAELIERKANPDDRRSLLIVATAPGRRMAEEFLAGLDGVVNKAVSDLDPAAADQLRDVLHQITVGMDEHQAVALTGSGVNGHAG